MNDKDSAAGTSTFAIAQTSTDVPVQEYQVVQLVNVASNNDLAQMTIEYVNSDAMTFDLTSSATLCSENGSNVVAGQPILAAPAALDATLVAATEGRLQIIGPGNVATTADDRIKPEEKLPKEDSIDEIQRRKDQRRIDRAIRTEANRIRMENRVNMGLEESKAKLGQSTTSEVENNEQLATKSGRRRKIPVRYIESQSEIAKNRSPNTDGQRGRPSLTRRQIVNKKMTKRTKNASKGASVEVPGEHDEDEEEQDKEPSDSEWTSEDDPDRLWCICQRPHDNKFMICCDACLNWFHGLCVGLTERKGRELESAGNDWTCAACRDPTSVAGKAMLAKLDKKAGAKDEDKDELKDVEIDEEVANVKKSKAKSKDEVERSKMGGKKPISPRKRNLAKHLQTTAVSERKTIRHDLCFNCEKQQRADDVSIYCSRKCLDGHLHKMDAYVMLQKNRGHVISVIAMEPSTHKMLVGPSAPPVEEIGPWLKAHPSFHFVLPTEIAEPKSYAPPPQTDSPSHVGGHKFAKLLANKRGQSTTKTDASHSGSVDVDKLLAPYKSAQVQAGGHRGRLATTAEIEQELLALANDRGGEVEDDGNVKRLSGQLPVYRSPSSSSSSAHHQQHHSLITKQKKISPVVRQQVVDDGIIASVVDREERYIKERSVRDNIRSGLREALFKHMNDRLGKHDDKSQQTPGGKEDGLLIVELTKRLDEYDNDVEALAARIASDIEHALFRSHKRDCLSVKYKSKYRSLVFNLRDMKNSSLLARLLAGDISARRLVSMSAEELASQELQQWRAKEVKSDIEKITAHEKSRAQDKFVVKSHKGETVVRPGEYIGNIESDVSVDPIPVAMPTIPLVPTTDSEEEEKISKKSPASKSSKSLDRDHLKKRVSHENAERSDKTKKQHKSKELNVSATTEKMALVDKMKRDETILQEKLASAERLLSSFKADIVTPDDAGHHDETYARSPSPATVYRPAAQSQSPTVSSSSFPPFTSLGSPSHVDRDGSLNSGGTTIWSGTIEPTEMSPFAVDATLISHYKCETLAKKLATRLTMVGRIPLPTVWTYLDQLRQHRRREISVWKLSWKSASSSHGDSDRELFNAFFSYLRRRQRMAVVGVSMPSIKDCYVTALGAGQHPHPSLVAHLSASSQSAPNVDSLILLVVHNAKDERHSTAAAAAAAKHSSAQSSYVPSTFSHISQDKLHHDPHRPAGADNTNHSSVPIPTIKSSTNELDEPYDPESISFDKWCDLTSAPGPQAVNVQSTSRASSAAVAQQRSNTSRDPRRR